MNHGWVTPRSDGFKARCGGPGMCLDCQIEAGRIKTGDSGQRYEVTFNDSVKRRVLGWTNSLQVAMRMTNVVTIHPVWSEPTIRDRVLLGEIALMSAAAKGSGRT